MMPRQCNTITTRHFHRSHSSRMFNSIKTWFGDKKVVGLSGEQFYHFSNFKMFIQQLKNFPQSNNSIGEFYEKFIKQDTAPKMVWEAQQLILLHKSNRAVLNARIATAFVVLMIMGWLSAVKQYLNEKDEANKKKLEVALIIQMHIILISSFFVQFTLKRIGFRLSVEPNYKQLITNNKQKMFVLETPTWIPLRYQHFSIPQDTVFGATIIEKRAKRPNIMIRQRIDTNTNWQVNPWFQRFYKDPSNTSFTAKGVRQIRNNLPFSAPELENVYVKSYIVPTRSQQEAQDLIAWLTDSHAVPSASKEEIQKQHSENVRSINRFF